MRRQRNSHLLVSKLCPDVLEAVFKMLLIPFDYHAENLDAMVWLNWGTDVSTALSISHVFHYWREVTLNIRALWNRPDFNRIKLSSLTIPRARGLPLIVLVDKLGGNRTLAGSVMRDAVMRAGWLACDPTENIARDIVGHAFRVNEAAPKLQVLNAQWHIPTLPSMTEETFPSLKVLRIYEGAMGDIYRHSLVHLLELDFKSQRGIPIPHVMHMLSCMEKLKRLILRGPFHHSIKEVNPLNAVCLPSLESLRVHGSLRSCARMFGALEFPAGAQVELQSCDDGDPLADTYVPKLVAAIKARYDAFPLSTTMVININGGVSVCLDSVVPTSSRMLVTIRLATGIQHVGRNLDHPDLYADLRRDLIRLIRGVSPIDLLRVSGKCVNILCIALGLDSTPTHGLNFNRLELVDAGELTAAQWKALQNHIHKRPPNQRLQMLTLARCTMPSAQSQISYRRTFNPWNSEDDQEVDPKRD